LRGRACRSATATKEIAQNKITGGNRIRESRIPILYAIYAIGQAI
jgi:hypothetical protein